MSSFESVFGTGVQPPGQLANVILNAAATYHVPPDVEAGIWRRETGSKFPNPWANGLGYGGEFGTAVTAPFGPASAIERIVEPPLQQQANTSASILAKQLQAHGGQLGPALSAYSGGGYTQVPGEITFGTVTGAGATGAPSGSGNTSGGGVSTSVGGATSTLQPAASGLSSLTGDISGSLREVFLRLAELAGGLFLLYLAARSAPGVLSGSKSAPKPPVVNLNVNHRTTVNAPQAPAGSSVGGGGGEVLEGEIVEPPSPGSAVQVIDHDVIDGDWTEVNNDLERTG